MNNFGQVISVVFPLLTVVIGAACALLLVSQKTLRDSRDDQEKRITFLEAKSRRDDDQIKTQGAELEALRKVVTGEVYLVSISDLLETHHNEAVGKWNLIVPTLQHVDTTLTGLHDELVRRERGDK